VASYWSWGLGRSAAPFAHARAVLASGRVPLLTWEPWILPPPGVDPGGWPVNRPFALARIADGAFDDYVRGWAEALREVGGPVYLRPMHEMNGDWYPWCGTTNGNAPRDFVRAWRHLHAVFTAAGANNVRWVWCPYVVSVPDRPDNSISAYFPGDQSVDWVGLDGYNWGASRPASCWQRFAEVFDRAYRVVTRLSARPVLLAEVGCAEAGGSKAAWLRDARDVLGRSFPRVRAVVWFNVAKECDWRVESSTASLRAFRDAWSGWERSGRAVTGPMTLSTPAGT
jgi:beta-mannanase